MTCNPLITHHNGMYHAWCKPCRWYDAPEHPFVWMARRDQENHKPQVETETESLPNRYQSHQHGSSTHVHRS